MAGPSQGGAGAAAGVVPGANGAADPDGAAAAPPPPPARTPVLAPPRVIATPDPLYPGDAFRLTLRRQDLGASAIIEGTEGTVTIRAFVLSTGDLRSVDVTGSSGSDVLDRAAAETVRGWRFAPATRDGAPIDAYVTLRVRYVVR